MLCFLCAIFVCAPPPPVSALQDCKGPRNWGESLCTPPHRVGGDVRPASLPRTCHIAQPLAKLLSVRSEIAQKKGAPRKSAPGSSWYSRGIFGRENGRINSLSRLGGSPARGAAGCTNALPTDAFRGVIRPIRLHPVLNTRVSVKRLDPGSLWPNHPQSESARGSRVISFPV